MQRINFYLSAVQIARLREKSGATGLPASELVRRAIDAYLDGPPVPAVAATTATAPARPIPRSRRGRPGPATRAARVAALAVDEEGPRDFDPGSANPGVAAGPEAGRDMTGGSNGPPSPHVPGHSGGDATRDDAEGGGEDDDGDEGDDGGGGEAEDEDAASNDSIPYAGAADPVSQREAAFQFDLAEKRYETEVFFGARLYSGGQDEAALGVLRNPTVSLTPLFRYCVALGMAAQVGGDLSAKFKDLAARFEAEAVEQYGASPAAYDRAWGGLIPEGLRTGTRQNSQA